MSTIYCLLTESGTSGTYWASLPTSGTTGNWKERYGNSTDGYRVYSSISSWKTAAASYSDWDTDIVLEIQGAWTDTSISGNISGYKSITITSKINGVYDTDSFHNGIIGGGFKASTSSSAVYLMTTTQQNCHVDGIEIENTNTTAGYGVRINAGHYGCSVKNCIIKAAYRGVEISGPLANVSSNIIRDCAAVTNGAGIYLNGAGAAGTSIKNNLVVGCGTYGFYVPSTFFGSVFGNIAYSNTTNWYVSGTLTSLVFAGFNCGVSGDTIPDSQETSTAINLTSTDFIGSGETPYAPASSSSAQVDTDMLIESDIVTLAINGVQRPSYNFLTPDKIDAGPYEYDYGNGLAPQSVTLLISGMAEGSVLAVYKTIDSSSIISPTTIGASGSHSITYSYTGDTQITVVVRKGTSGTKYLPYTAPGLITSSGFSLIVNQVVDGVLNG